MSIYTPKSLESIKGVGTVSLDKLNRAGINSKFDLICFLPRGYQSINFVKSLAEVQPGEITVLARATNIKARRTSRVTTILTADLEDETGKIQAIWFNQPYRARQIQIGKFYFTGKFDLNRGRYQLMNPSVKQANRENANLARDHLEPIYSQAQGLKSSFFNKIIEDIKPDILTLNESLPDVVVRELDLMSRSDAMYQLHFPTNPELLQKAQWRVQFEDYFLASLASTINGLSRQAQKTNVIKDDVELVKKFLAGLEFELTADQKRAVWKIMQQMSSGQPMNLLLQGDVGSGKTLVSEIISLLTVKAGFQVAVLAPTEVLARQHLASFKRDLKSFKVKIAELTGSTKDKKAVYEKIKQGKTDVVVGTHALFQEKVEFKNLALVVIDEQHRFGVDQRQAIVAKAKLMPHLLAMTATPIPRSLALTIRNEVTIASIRQKPANRLPILTEVYSNHNRLAVYEKIKEQLEQGRQVYVVCGRIDESDEEQRDSVEAVYKTLQKGILSDYKLAILHGKLKPVEKDELMINFKADKIDVLVSTTVIEVGVDVPNATAIAIHDAENYGLAQLHQLRGRVGRSDLQSYCYLLTSLDEPNERLQAIANSQDGFYLSEVDLRLRGAGNIYGSQQHGWFKTEFNLQAVEKAQEAVKIYLDDLKAKNKTPQDDLDNFPELKERLEQFDQIRILN
ncbi:MAG: ATP-dependent DNA helicase RecG [Candidatus Nanosyncoccaceae bacterium]|jgi:ATP-dependent DNA helicase RecG